MNDVDEGGKPSRYFKVLVKPYLENGEAECSYSKKGYTFKNIHNNIQQLTNLEVDGIDGAKSHLTCYNEKISNSPKFFYLGQFKGYYYAQKSFVSSTLMSGFEMLVQHTLSMYLLDFSRVLISIFYMSQMFGFIPIQINIHKPI